MIVIKIIIITGIMCSFISVYAQENKSNIRTYKAGLKTTAGIWSGVTMHNLLLIAGASNPVGLIGGTLFGAYMYKKEEDILNSEN